jgi:hypothetical protein
MCRTTVWWQDPGICRNTSVLEWWNKNTGQMKRTRTRKLKKFVRFQWG